jgi:hypothetical protein
MTSRARFVLLAALLVSCKKRSAGVALPDAGDTKLSDASFLTAVDAASDATNSTTASSSGSPSSAFAAWLRERLPSGGAVEMAGPEHPKVIHKVTASDTALSIAGAYLDLTDVYAAKDLAAIISKENPSFAAGDAIAIPHLLPAPYKSPDQDRLGWPEDKALRGVFITGPYAGIRWVDTLDKLAARKLNAVVLDGKAYEGTVTYPSKVKVALETKAGENPPIPDLARAIRFAHARAIRVIIRVACFHDPWAAKHAPRLSLMGNWGGPFPMGWLDPTNVEAQDYMIDLAKEAIDAGADEIQLDYVRFPVQAKSIDSAVMPKPHGQRSKAMRDFVRRVHEVTRARNIPLSLDVFGVTATGDQDDIERLGQDIGTLGPEAEVLSPMVYPSHYSDGWRGFEKPGNHPEIVGIGTKAALAKLNAAHVEGTLIRSWLQASDWKSTNYGPEYLRREAKSAEGNGGVGWLLWNPGCEYWPAWRAFPVVDGN